MAISAAALNGRMVKPGDTMSFNDCTGQRTGEKGYREAGAIAGGVLVDDTGGGVAPDVLHAVQRRGSRGSGNRQAERA
ncbi:MAG: VanW family protein [Christensenellales bacterium]